MTGLILNPTGKFIYQPLNPGIIHSKVKSANSSGTWTNNCQQLKIEILPPFWATTWAYMFYAI
jgi:hypothetical protein